MFFMKFSWFFLTKESFILRAIKQTLLDEIKQANGKNSQKVYYISTIYIAALQAAAATASLHARVTSAKSWRWCFGGLTRPGLKGYF